MAGHYDGSDGEGGRSALNSESTSSRPSVDTHILTLPNPAVVGRKVHPLIYICLTPCVATIPPEAPIL